MKLKSIRRRCISVRNQKITVISVQEAEYGKAA